MVQEAANAAGSGKIVADGVFGSRTFDAIKEIAGSEDQTRKFLDELANRRGVDGFESEKPRFNHFRRQ